MLRPLSRSRLRQSPKTATKLCLARRSLTPAYEQPALQLPRFSLLDSMATRVRLATDVYRRYRGSYLFPGKPSRGGTLASVSFPSLRATVGRWRIYGVSPVGRGDRRSRDPRTRLKKDERIEDGARETRRARARAREITRRDAARRVAQLEGLKLKVVVPLAH